jgi:ethanolamine ammonia-lyase small subunit
MWIGFSHMDQSLLPSPSIFDGKIQSMKVCNQEAAAYRIVSFNSRISEIAAPVSISKCVKKRQSTSSMLCLASNGNRLRTELLLVYRWCDRYEFWNTHQSTA